MWKKLFGESGVKNVVTLFHKPSSAPSMRVFTLLKQANATAVSHATEDQASDHSTHSQSEKHEFELDVQEQAPTPDQLNSIFEYVGESKASELVEGASDASDALSKLKKKPELFKRPVVVDWNNGKAVVGDNQSQILELLRSLPK